MNTYLWYRQEWINRRNKLAFLKRDRFKYEYYYRDSWDRYVKRCNPADTSDEECEITVTVEDVK